MEEPWWSDLRGYSLSGAEGKGRVNGHHTNAANFQRDCHYCRTLFYQSQHCTRWEGDLAFSSKMLIARRGEFWLACENWVGLRPRQVPTHFPHSSDQSFTFMISQVGTGDIIIIIIIIIISMTMKVIFTTSRSMILHILWKTTMRTMTKNDKWQFRKFSHLAISQSRDTWPINTSDKTIIEMCSLLEFDKFGVNSPVSAIPTNQAPDPRFF